MTLKDVQFLGRSRKDLQKLPKDVRRDLGGQLYLLQMGLRPDSWRAMPTVGKGVSEIKIEVDTNIYRTFYVANIGDCIYILHVFQKKTQQTSKKDIAHGQTAYKELKAELRRKR